MLTEWACFLHKGLSFLEKKGWPSRLVEQTCGERRTVEVFSFSRAAQVVFTHVLLEETVARTYHTHKTGVMPGESQSLQELVSRLNGEVTTMAIGPKHGVVV